MTVQTTQVTVSYNGNGSVKVFAIPFPYLEPVDITAKKTTNGVETDLEYGTDYTVANGNATLVVAPPTGTSVTFTRMTPMIQPVDLRRNSTFPEETIEQELDRLTMMVQEDVNTLNVFIEKLPENVQDFINQTLVAGENIVISYDDDAGTITISSLDPDWDDITGKPSTFPPSSHTHTTGQIAGLQEYVEDLIGVSIVAGSNITLSYNDSTGKLTINATGSGGGGDAIWGSITGTLSNQVDLNNALNAKFDKAGGTVTGAIVSDPVALVNSGTLELTQDPLITAGDVYRLRSTAPVAFTSPSTFLDSGQVGFKVAGAQTGSLMVVSGIDAEGFALLGFQSPIPPAYSVNDTVTTPIVIKVSGTAPPTAWVELGLIVTLAQNLDAGTANLAFEGIFTNTTARTGTVEFGLNVNGADLFREIKVQIGANYNQTIAMTIPLQNAYVAGDIIKLIARVTNNDNNQFGLTMANSATDIGAMRIYEVGTGGGSGSDAETVDGWSIEVVTSMPAVPDPNTIYFVQGETGTGTTVAWADITGKPTTLSGYGITDAYTKVESNANYPTKAGGGATGTWNIGISGNAATATNATNATNANSATVASTVDNTNGLNNIAMWIGTEADYNAIVTKNPNVLYFRSA